MIHDDRGTERCDEANRGFSQRIRSRLVTAPIKRREIATALKCLQILKNKQQKLTFLCSSDHQNSHRQSTGDIRSPV